jgi:hypothetical protein
LLNLPQTRHKPERASSENRGFLRVTAGWLYVAKMDGKSDFLSIDFI